MGKLSAVAVKAALANPGTYQDGDGLFLKVGKSGAASWLVRLQQEGKRRDIGLGSAKLLTLAEAREKAGQLDALYFILYGVWDSGNPAKSRDDIRYIYSTFPTVEREERARYSDRYRSPELALLWINALMAGQPDAAINA